MPRQEQISPENTKQSNFKKLLVSCPFCESPKHKKRGFRKTKLRGKIQRYECLGCNKRFTKRDGFFAMKNDSQKSLICYNARFSP